MEPLPFPKSGEFKGYTVRTSELPAVNAEMRNNRISVLGLLDADMQKYGYAV